MEFGIRFHEKSGFYIPILAKKRVLDSELPNAKWTSWTKILKENTGEKEIIEVTDKLI